MFSAKRPGASLVRPGERPPPLVGEVDPAKSGREGALGSLVMPVFDSLLPLRFDRYFDCTRVDAECRCEPPFCFWNCQRFFDLRLWLQVFCAGVNISQIVGNSASRNS